MSRTNGEERALFTLKDILSLRVPINDEERKSLDEHLERFSSSEYLLEHLWLLNHASYELDVSRVFGRNETPEQVVHRLKFEHEKAAILEEFLFSDRTPKPHLWIRRDALPYALQRGILATVEKEIRRSWKLKGSIRRRLLGSKAFQVGTLMPYLRLGRNSTQIPVYEWVVSNLVKWSRVDSLSDRRREWLVRYIQFCVCLGYLHSIYEPPSFQERTTREWDSVRCRRDAESKLEEVVSALEETRIEIGEIVSRVPECCSAFPSAKAVAHFLGKVLRKHGWKRRQNKNTGYFWVKETDLTSCI